MPSVLPQRPVRVTGDSVSSLRPRGRSSRRGARELADLQRTLQVEQTDVRRLEKLSPTKIWATLRGDTADRLAIERAEADAAQLAVAGAQARLDSAIADDARAPQRTR